MVDLNRCFTPLLFSLMMDLFRGQFDSPAADIKRDVESSQTWVTCIRKLHVLKCMFLLDS